MVMEFTLSYAPKYDYPCGRSALQVVAVETTILVLPLQVVTTVGDTGTLDILSHLQVWLMLSLVMMILMHLQSAKRELPMMCVCVCVFGQHFFIMHISLNNMDIFCLHMFVFVLSSCRIDFIVSGGNWLMKFQ